MAVVNHNRPDSPEVPDGEPIVVGDGPISYHERSVVSVDPTSPSRFLDIIRHHPRRAAGVAVALITIVGGAVWHERSDSPEPTSPAASSDANPHNELKTIPTLPNGRPTDIYHVGDHEIIYNTFPRTGSVALEPIPGNGGLEARQPKAASNAAKFKNIVMPGLLSTVFANQQVDVADGTCVTEVLDYRDRTTNQTYYVRRFYVNPFFYQRGNDRAYIGVGDGAHVTGTYGQLDANGNLHDQAFGWQNPHIITLGGATISQVVVEGSLSPAGEGNTEKISAYTGVPAQAGFAWQQTGAVGFSRNTGRHDVYGGIANVVKPNDDFTVDEETDACRFLYDMTKGQS